MLWRRGELLALLPMLEDQVVQLHQPLGLLQPAPLQVHASYTREEILAAFGASGVKAPSAASDRRLLVRADENRPLFRHAPEDREGLLAHTRGLDYAISDRFFH